MPYGFEVRVRCKECGHRWWADADVKPDPSCPLCSIVGVED